MRTNVTLAPINSAVDYVVGQRCNMYRQPAGVVLEIDAEHPFDLVQPLIQRRPGQVRRCRRAGLVVPAAQVRLERADQVGAVRVVVGKQRPELAVGKTGQRSIAAQLPEQPAQPQVGQPVEGPFTMVEPSAVETFCFKMTLILGFTIYGDGSGGV